MKKLTRRRKEILSTALSREQRSRPGLKTPRNHSEREVFEALCREGFGEWTNEDGMTVFALTQKGRDVAASLKNT